MLMQLIRFPLVITIKHGKHSRILGAKHCAFLKDLQKNLVLSSQVATSPEPAVQEKIRHEIVHLKILRNIISP